MSRNRHSDMARKPRDYAAEYASRIARERGRAAHEGRPFARARARGYGNRDIETLIRQSSPYNIEGMTDAVEQSTENGVSREEIIALLQDKKSAFNAKRHGDPTVGHNRFNGDTRVQWLPIEFYYYHGQ